MCGIAGIIGDCEPVGRDHKLRLMTQEMSRRGPDSEGFETWPAAALGHRRLAILDLTSAGRQPMVSPDRSVGVVFNGAIYNFLDLRAELEDLGCVFRSHTDTEVLLHGYREWGAFTLATRLRGMFAFAVWDERSRTLYLVRDRLGVKPLIYFDDGRTLAFASSVRALRLAGFGGGIDPAAVADFLHFGYIREHLAIYAGLRKLAPASILEWRDGDCRIQSYWQSPEADPRNPVRFEEAVEETERLLLRAVRMRLYADVKVATLLSGGIDSGLVAWAAGQHGADLTAYTLAVPGDPWDESADASATASRLGVRHEVLQVDTTSLASIGEFISAYAEPFACNSGLGALAVSKAVRGSATVLLTGDGGDDVFLGYPDFRNFWNAERLARALPPAFGPVWSRLNFVLPRIGPLRRARNFLNYAAGGIGAVAQANDGLGWLRRQGILGERLHGAPVPGHDLPWSTASARRLVQDFQNYLHRGQFVSEFLTKVDGATMYHSLEARSPFLDQELWEYACRLPVHVRLHSGSLKAVLRAVARRRLGNQVSARRKTGFSIPAERWVATRWYPHVEECFRASMLGEEGWIRTRPIEGILKSIRRRGWAPAQVWRLYVLENWMRCESGRSGPWAWPRLAARLQ